MTWKDFLNKIKTEFANTRTHETNTDSGQDVGELSPEERDRRIRFAAEYTVREYGSVIERLAKE